MWGEFSSLGRQPTMRIEPPNPVIDQRSKKRLSSSVELFGVVTLKIFERLPRRSLE